IAIVSDDGSGGSAYVRAGKPAAPSTAAPAAAPARTERREILSCAKLPSVSSNVPTPLSVTLCRTGNRTPFLRRGQPSPGVVAESVDAADFFSEPATRKRWPGCAQTR